MEQIRCDTGTNFLHAIIMVRDANAHASSSVRVHISILLVLLLQTIAGVVQSAYAHAWHVSAWCVMETYVDVTV